MALWSFMNMLLVIIWSQHFFEAPQVGETSMSGAFPDWGPGPLSSLASTAAPFESRSSAAATWPWRVARWSGVQPQALFSRKAVWPLWASGGRRGRGRGDDESGGNAELYTRSTDKRTMNVLDSTSSKLFTCTNTLDKFQYIFFTASLLMKIMQY